MDDDGLLWSAWLQEATMKISLGRFKRGQRYRTVRQARNDHMNGFWSAKRLIREWSWKTWGLKRPLLAKKAKGWPLSGSLCIVHPRPFLYNSPFFQEKMADNAKCPLSTEVQSFKWGIIFSQVCYKSVLHKYPLVTIQRRMRSKVSDTNDISSVTHISGLDIARKAIWRIIELEHFERLEIFIHFARGRMKRSNKEIYKSSGYNNYEARQGGFRWSERGFERIGIWEIYRERERGNEMRIGCCKLQKQEDGC